MPAKLDHSAKCFYGNGEFPDGRMKTDRAPPLDRSGHGFWPEKN
jgi:hypothetical protein